MAPGFTGWKTSWWVPLDANIRTRRVRELLSGVPNALKIMAGNPMIRTVKGKPYAYVAGWSLEGDGMSALFEFNFDSGLTAIVSGGHRNTDEWLVDAAGKPLAETIYDPETKKWSLHVANGGGWKVPKIMTAEIERPHIIGLGRDEDRKSVV